MASSLKLFVLLIVVVALPRFAAADVTLQNDGFMSGGQAYVQLGFKTGDIGASRFVAPDAGRQLLKAQLLFGGATSTNTITFKVWDDTASATVPGVELFSMDYQLTGSDSALQEIDVSANNVIVPQQFRVGIVWQYDGTPAIFRDGDGTIMPDKNFIYDTNSSAWYNATTFMLQGDWIIRAVVSGTATGGGDAGVTGPDAAVTGQTCTGNAQCPMGQFCDLQNHACTFECRVNTDCPGGGTCNSLGMCVGGGGGGGGGCCQAGPGEGRGAAVLALGVLGLVLRRRRQRA